MKQKEPSRFGMALYTIQVNKGGLSDFALFLFGEKMGLENFCVFPGLCRCF